MNNRSIAFSVVLLLILVPSALADEPVGKAWWKWSRDGSSNTTGPFKTVSWPQLNVPRIQAFDSVKNSAGRVWNGTKNATSKAWHATADFLNPWNDGSAAGENRGDAWYFKKKEDAEITTVNDFLRQKRPQF